MKNKFAIIGQSASGNIYKEIFLFMKNRHSIDASFEYILCPSKSDIEDLTDSLRQNSYTGAQILSPFKQQVFSLADLPSDRSMISKSSNLMFFSQGRIYGDDSLGESVFRDITKNAQYDLTEKDVLIICGNNYSFLSMLTYLEDSPAKSIYLLSRSPEKIINSINRKKHDIQKIFIENITDFEGNCDLIINSTSFIFNNQHNPINTNFFKKDFFVYDINYEPHERNGLLEKSKSLGGKSRDGFGRIVEECVDSLGIWLGMNIKIDENYVNDIKASTELNDESSHKAVIVSKEKPQKVKNCSAK